MNKFVKSPLLIIFIIMVAVMATACSGFTPAQDRSSPTSASSTPIKPTNGVVQSNEAGSVAIEVQWVKVEGNSLVFKVAMDTHSVALDQYDLGKLAVLRDDTGKEYRPVSWDAPPGGHHLEGRLTFPLPDSVSQGKTKYVEIVIRNVAGIEERVLRWEL